MVCRAVRRLRKDGSTQNRLNPETEEDQSEQVG